MIPALIKVISEPNVQLLVHKNAIAALTSITSELESARIAALDSGVVPMLVRFLEGSHNLELQHAALVALGQVVSTPALQAKHCVTLNAALHQLNRLLDVPDLAVRFNAGLVLERM